MYLDSYRSLDYRERHQVLSSDRLRSIRWRRSSMSDGRPVLFTFLTVLASRGVSKWAGEGPVLYTGTVSSRLPGPSPVRAVVP